MTNSIHVVKHPNRFLIPIRPKQKFSTSNLFFTRRSFHFFLLSFVEFQRRKSKSKSIFVFLFKENEQKQSMLFSRQMNKNPFGKKLFSKQKKFFVIIFSVFLSFSFSFRWNFSRNFCWTTKYCLRRSFTFASKSSGKRSSLKRKSVFVVEWKLWVIFQF